MVTKAVMVKRLFTGSDDKDAVSPSMNDDKWIDVNKNTPDVKICSDVLWVKINDQSIQKAFYCRMPGREYWGWIDRYQDDLLGGVTQWMELKKSN